MSMCECVCMSVFDCCVFECESVCVCETVRVCAYECACACVCV